ncbi:asparaginase [Alphaproteobacteria bacterium]|nr:asparaginase [Alphaproteobacteria bacterium]
MSLKIVHNLTTYITRGKITESIHKSKCIIKDYNYKTIFSTNNNTEMVYPRSAIKVFQSIPFVKSQAYKKYSLSPKQIAISCASHYGEKEHIRVLTEWIKKININKKMLKCGIHNPLNLNSSNNLLLSGKVPNELYNNCAGKHLAMLTGCMMYGLDTQNYVSINHPYQKYIRNILEHFSECKISNQQKGIDGCSAPQYAFPLESLSISMINLIKNFKENLKYSKEVRLLINSVVKYPHLIGSKAKYDSQLMQVTNGKVFAKWGAEGVLLFCHNEKKIGGVIKVIDGNERALPSTANEIFKKIKLLNSKELKQLSNWTRQPIYNHAKIQTGKIYSKIT